MSVLLHVTPGGTTGINAKTLGRPWEHIQYPPQVIVGSSFEFVLSTNGAGVTENNVDLPNKITGWHWSIPLASAQFARHGLGWGDLAGGLTQFGRLVPFASILSGAIVSPLADKFGHWYMEMDVKLAAVIGDGTEIEFIFAPSFCPFAGTLGNAGGFGLAWFNTAVNDNYRLFIAAENALLVNIDTGINALTANIRLIRIEWGWIAGAPRIRAFIDTVQVAEVVGPLVLDTLGKIAAFSKGTYVGVDKMGISAANSVEAWAGMGRGLEIGRVDI